MTRLTPATAPPDVYAFDKRRVEAADQDAARADAGVSAFRRVEDHLRKKDSLVRSLLGESALASSDFRDLLYGDRLDELMDGEPSPPDGDLDGPGLAPAARGRAQRRAEASERRQQLVAWALREAKERGLGGLAYIGSVLDKGPAAMRGLVAGVGHLLRGDARKGVDVAVGNLSFLVPFSEGFLRPLVSGALGRAGVTMPREHLTGREMLEAWGAPKNVPGFHPIQRPADALFDALGLLADIVVVPPYAPALAVGAAGRLGRVARAARGEVDALRLATDALSEPAVASKLNAVLKSLQANKPLDTTQRLQRLGAWIRDNVPDAQYLFWHETDLPVVARASFRRAVEAGTADDLLRGLRDAESYYTVTTNIRSITPVGDASLSPPSLSGKIEAMRQGGQRYVGLGLKPVAWGWRIGLPEIEIAGSRAVAPYLESIASWRPVRYFRAIFDWTARGMSGAASQVAADRATDSALYLQRALQSDMVPLQRAYVALANRWAGLQKAARLAGDRAGQAEFTQVMQFLAEQAHRYGRTLDERVLRLTDKLFPGVPAANKQAALEFMRDATQLAAERFENLLADTLAEARRAGVPMSALDDLFSTYVPSRRAKKLPGLLDEGTIETQARAALVEPGVAAAMRHLRSRLAARRNIPGGRVALNIATSDGWFGLPKTRVPLYDGDLMVRTGRGTLAVNDYVRLGDGHGRIIGFTKQADGSLAAAVRDVEGKTHLLPPGTLTRTLGPTHASQVVPAIDMTADQMRQYLQNRLAAVDPRLLVDLPTKPTRVLGELQRRWAVENIFSHFFDTLSPEEIVFFDATYYTLRPHLAKELARQRLPGNLFAQAEKALAESGQESRWAEMAGLGGREAQKAIFEQLAPRMSPQVRKIVRRAVVRGRGISGLVMNGIRKRAGGLAYDGDLFDSVMQYMYDVIDLTGVVHGLRSGLSQAAFVPAATMRNIDAFIASPAGPMNNPSELLRLPPDIAETTVSLRDAYKMLGFPSRIGRKGGVEMYRIRRLTDEGLDGALGRAISTMIGTGRLPQQGTEKLHRVAARLAEARSDIQVPDLIRIPKQAVAQLRVFARSGMPRSKETTVLGTAVSKFLSIWSSWMTYPAIAFSTRNFKAGLYMAAASDGGFPAGKFLTRLASHTMDLLRMAWHGKDPKEVYNALRALPFGDEIEMVQLLRGAGRSVEHNAPLTATPATTLASLSARQIAAPLTASLGRGGLRKWLNITKVPGVAKPGDYHPAIEAGRRLSEAADAIPRIAHYQTLREFGMEPGRAAELVTRTHFDYTRLSPVEKEHFRPLIMFYSWMRSNLGYLIPRLMLDPGGRPAQVLRAYSRVSAAGQGQLPAWLQDVMAVPLPIDTKDGKTPVVRSFGLPLEDLAILGSLMHGDVRSFLRQAIARSNPIVSSAYRIATGEDPYRQRPVTPSDTTLLSWRGRLAPGVPEGVGKVAAVAEPVMPGVRALAQFKRLLEDADSLGGLALGVMDLLTGIKSDRFDLGALRLSDAIRQLKRRLDRMPRIDWGSYPYVSPNYGPATAEETQAMEAYRALHIARREAYAKLYGLPPEAARTSTRGKKAKAGEGSDVGALDTDLDDILMALGAKRRRRRRSESITESMMSAPPGATLGVPWEQYNSRISD